MAVSWIPVCKVSAVDMAILGSEWGSLPTAADLAAGSSALAPSSSPSFHALLKEGSRP